MARTGEGYGKIRRGIKRLLLNSSRSSREGDMSDLGGQDNSNVSFISNALIRFGGNNWLTADSA